MAEALVAFRKGEDLDSGGAGFSGAMILAQALGDIRGLLDGYCAVHKKR